MRTIRVPLSLTLLFAALVLFAYYGTNLASGPIEFLYNSVPGYSAASNLAQIAALVAVVCLFVAAAFIAVPTALQPGIRLHKLLYVLPLYLLAVTLAGIVSGQLGIGTTGTLFGGGGLMVNFASAWVAAGAILSVVAVVMAAATTKLSENVVKTVARVLALTTLVSVVATLAMVATVIVVLTNQPRLPNSGRQPGVQGARRPAATQAAQGASATQSAAPATQPAQGGQPSQGAPGQASAVAGQTGQAGQGGQGRPGGGPGGPGGGLAAITQRYTMGGALMGILGALELVSLVSLWRGSRTLVAASASAPVQESRLNYGREIGSVVVSGLVISVVVLAAIQVVPVSRDNPPVQASVQWDSPQTRDLFMRACGDCHSNETRWPWYAYIAPSSWLTTMHVHDGRAQFNLSDLNNVLEFRRAELPNEAAQQLRMGTMPPKDYLLLHPEARLSDAEKQALIDGLRKSLSS
jgi:hypothetical protein